VTELARGRLRHAASAKALLAQEQELGLADRFELVDAVLNTTIAAALSGERILEIAARRQGPSLLKLTNLLRNQRDWLNTNLAKSAHEAKGSWYLPKTLKVNAGAFILTEALIDQPRFATSVISAQGTETSSAAGETVFIWAALEPLFATLALPLILRSRQAGTKKPEEARRAWVEIDRLLTALGLAEMDAIVEFRSDAAWVQASPDDHARRRFALGEALRASADPGIGRRYRAFLLQALIQRYDAKAKKEQPTRSQVLRRTDERTLTALFAGDWLAFLDYLGEQPAMGEEMVTDLPQPKLFVSGGDKATAVAADVGVPSEEVERILGALFGGGEAISPIKEREHALRNLWQALDELYARQEPNMLRPDLYPLGEDWGDDLHDDEDALELEWETRRFLEDVRAATLAGEALESGSDVVRLPADVVREIEELFATETIERYPKTLVTALNPWRQARSALGPALAFWHELLLRLWQNFEEDYDSRAVPALGSHLRDLRRGLSSLGFAVDDAMFVKLIEAEQTLPPPQEIVPDKYSESVQSVMGIEFRMTVSAGPSTRRRPGFTTMRDIATAYRRAWANKHLDAYLERLWQNDLHAVAEAINRHHAEKRKPPTARQLSGMAAAAANSWCGGQIGLLCAAIGEKDTIHQTYAAKVPANRRLFLRRLFSLLGGEAVEKIRYREDDEETQRVKREAAERQRGIGVLTIGALRLLQLEEAIGATPALKQYGTADFRGYAERVWPGEPADELWGRYIAAVREALAGNSAPADFPSPRTSRPPVKLRAVEPEPEPERLALPSAPKPPRRGLVALLFGRSHQEQDAASAAGEAGLEAYALQSEGWSDVVGESYYQDALQATRRLLRYDRELGREIFDAFLVLEPDNPYDPKAVAVHSGNGKIGHVPRGSLWFQVLSELADAGYAKAKCRAWLIGGTEGKSLGAVLCGDPDEELSLLLDQGLH
jgi:hypothetical protein